MVKNIQCESEFFLKVLMSENLKETSVVSEGLKADCLLFLTATDLINNLLQVKMRKRYSVDKSLSHPWLQVTELL